MLNKLPRLVGNKLQELNFCLCAFMRNRDLSPLTLNMHNKGQENTYYKLFNNDFFHEPSPNWKVDEVVLV